jgi:hypothetical protein
MSSGGIFAIVANDGKADKMIMATGLLEARINDIKCAKQRDGFKDLSPTIMDIEKTHIIFVAAHFKPFAALGYEYNKVSGSQNLGYGASTQITIPLFGDFFHDMVLNITLGAVSATAGFVPAFPAAPVGTTVTDSAASRIAIYADTTGHVYNRYKYEYVTKNGTVKNVGDAAYNYVRYCEYPGQRLLSKVKFEVSGNPLDEYTREATSFYQKFCVLPHKQVGWKRLMGQEVAILATSDLLTIAGTSSYDGAASNGVDAAGLAVSGMPANASVTSRRESYILNGAQTAKATQPPLELWIPLLFWFNRDVRLAIPSVAIPYGTRFITIDIAQQNEIVFTAPGDLFLRLTTEQFTNATGLEAGAAISSIKTYRTLTPVYASGSVVDTTQTISKFDTYINNIFVSPDIHDIYIKRVGFSLIRVHRMHTEKISNNAGRILLSSLKWPVEYFYLGIRPDFNVSAANPNQARDWHRLTSLTDNVVDINTKSFGRASYDQSATVDLSVTALLAETTLECQSTVERISYPVEAETLDSIKIEAHGIVLYQTLKSTFFRDYIPWHFGGINLNTPEDRGALMVNFCLYPGTYQPSGHINVSRVREFYIEYASSVLSSTFTGTLFVISSSLNFLLISDGSAVLRYST